MTQLSKCKQKRAGEVALWAGGHALHAQGPGLQGSCLGVALMTPEVGEASNTSPAPSIELSGLHGQAEYLGY